MVRSVATNKVLPLVSIFTTRTGSPIHLAPSLTIACQVTGGTEAAHAVEDRVEMAEEDEAEVVLLEKFALVLMMRQRLQPNP